MSARYCKTIAGWSLVPQAGRILAVAATVAAVMVPETGAARTAGTKVTDLVIAQGPQKLVVTCDAGGDDWRRNACEGLAAGLRERMPGAEVRIAGDDSNASAMRVSVEWVRSHETFVMARLSWRQGAEAAAQGPVIEFSVNDRRIEASDARPFGRTLADTFPLGG